MSQQTTVMRALGKQVGTLECARQTSLFTRRVIYSPGIKVVKGKEGYKKVWFTKSTSCPVRRVASSQLVGVVDLEEQTKVTSEAAAASVEAVAACEVASDVAESIEQLAAVATITFIVEELTSTAVNDEMHAQELLSRTLPKMLMKSLLKLSKCLCPLMRERLLQQLMLMQKKQLELMQYQL